jgi:hypothetical protein
MACALAAACAFGACSPGELFVRAELRPDEDCDYAPDPALALDHAVYDIATGSGPDSVCGRAYRAHLLTDNSASDPVLVDAAEVHLTTISHQALAFRGDLALPNPLLLTVMSPVRADGSGVVAVEAIPRAYAPQLEDFVGSSLIASIRLFGETSDGDELESNAFALQIEICDGCLTLCASELEGREVTVEALLGGEICDGSRETGGTVCVDPEC